MTSPGSRAAARLQAPAMGTPVKLSTGLPSAGRTVSRPPCATRIARWLGELRVAIAACAFQLSGLRVSPAVSESGPRGTVVNTKGHSCREANRMTSWRAKRDFPFRFTIKVYVMVSGLPLVVDEMLRRGLPETANRTWIVSSGQARLGSTEKL